MAPVTIDRFHLWELHHWQACDTCGLDGAELTQPYELSRTIHGGADEPLTETVVVAPPLARFLTTDEAREVFADQLTTVTRYYEPVEVSAFGESEPVFVKGRELR